MMKKNANHISPTKPIPHQQWRWEIILSPLSTSMFCHFFIISTHIHTYTHLKYKFICISYCIGFSSSNKKREFDGINIIYQSELK